MATTIKTKNSTTAATAPTGLAQGELAVNITDKKLYVGDAVGNSIQIAGAGATNAAGGSNTQVQYNSSGALAGSANMTFDGTSLTLGGNPTLSAGTANGVAYLNGSKVLTSGSALTYNGSTLGIKAGNGNQLVLDNAAEQYTLLEYKNNGTSKAQSYWDNTNTLFEQYIGVGSGFGFTWKASATELMRLTSTGLGIGTTSPAYKLDINPGSSGGGLQVYNPANTNTARVRVANSQSSFDMGQDGTGGYLEQIGAYPIRFYNNNAERMRIDTSGNLLVGTTNTAASNNCLVVQGNITAVNGGYTQNLYYNGGWKYAANGYGWSNYITSGALIWESAGNNASGFGAAATTTERMRIDSSGNLLVGTTSSTGSYKIETTGALKAAAGVVTGSSGGVGIGADTTNNTFFTSSLGAGSTTMYIGNKSINTTSDIRIKANVKPTERNAVELLSQWEVVDHTWNDPSDTAPVNRNSRGVWTGVVAQQIIKSTPWLVNAPDKDCPKCNAGEHCDEHDTWWQVDFEYAVPLLVKAIQEQQALITDLTNRLTALENK